MTRLLKRMRIGKYAIPMLLLLTIAVGTVAAVVYVVLTYTISLDVAAHPRVAFWDGANVENTMTIDMNIFPDIKTIDTDAAWDIRANASGNINIRVSSMDTNEVASVNITAYETVVTSPLFTVEWTSATTTWSGPYLTGVTDYNLWIEVTGASGATGPTTSITVELKVESP